MYCLEKDDIFKDKQFFGLSRFSKKNAKNMLYFSWAEVKMNAAL